MNGPALHLLICHLPVVLSLIAFVVLVAGRGRRDEAVTRVGLVLGLVSALVGVPAFLTGPPAVAALQSDTSLSALMVAHAQSAVWGLLAVMVFGTVAVAALKFKPTKPALAETLTKLAVALGFVAMAVMGAVAQTGNEVRHPEVRAAATPSPAP